MCPEQLIDANLDRAREGLRVIEDWCRFGLKRRDLVLKLKDWRQKLGLLHLEIYKKARSTHTDHGIGLKHHAQELRNRPKEIVQANCARAQEALRVIEEFARTSDPKLASTCSEIRYCIYTIEIDIIRATNQQKRLQKLNSCRLCLITTPKEDLTNIVTESLKAGVTMVQYRSKDESDLEKLTQARNLATICNHYKALFIINDRIDIALAVNADGVHLGQNDLSTEVARKLMGEECLIGKSAHSIEDIKNAKLEGCDYLGIGPINKSPTKPHLEPKGFEYIDEALKTTDLPCFAIGGIDKLDINKLRSKGVSRIAVVGAIMNAKDSGKASQELLDCLV